MLTPADVLKIKCKFVEKMKAFLTKRMSQVDVCYCEVLPYFADAQLASTLYDADCLTIEQECTLEKKADKYSAQPELNPNIVPCSDQVSISLAKVESACSVSGIVENASGQAFPRIVLSNNSIYHDAVLDMKITDCITNTVQTEQIRVGCTGTPEVCTDSQRVAGIMTFLLTTPTTTYPGGYIQTLRLYQTDSNGLLVNSPIDLDVTPSNVGYWNGCGSCTVVNGADLYFTSGNYKTAWLALMENISQTLFGGDYIDANLTQGSIWLYQFKIKHNPSGIWLGPNKNDFVVSIYNGFGTSTVNTVAAFTQGSFLHQELDFDVNCGTVTGTADSFAGAGATTSSLANFNYLDFLTQDIPLPISLSLTGDSSCTIAKLTATYSATSAISSIQWLDPSNAVISTTNVVYINTDDTGVYTFKVTLANGCVVTDTITIT